MNPKLRTPSSHCCTLLLLTAALALPAPVNAGCNFGGDMGQASVRLDTLGCPSTFDTRQATVFSPVSMWELQSQVLTPTVEPPASGSIELRVIQQGSRTILECRGTLIVTNSGAGPACTESYVANLQIKKNGNKPGGSSGFLTVLTAVDDERTGRTGKAWVCDPSAGAILVPAGHAAPESRVGILERSTGRDVVQDFPGNRVEPVSQRDNPLTQENETCKGAPIYNYVVDFPLDNSSIKPGDVLRLEIIGTYTNAAYPGNQGALCTADLDGNPGTPSEVISSIPTRFTFTLPTQKTPGGREVILDFDESLDPAGIASIESIAPEGPFVLTQAEARTIVTGLSCDGELGGTAALRNIASLVPGPGGQPSPYFSSLYIRTASSNVAAAVLCAGPPPPPATGVGDPVCEGYFCSYNAGDIPLRGYGADPGTVLDCFLDLYCDGTDMSCDPLDGGLAPFCGLKIGSQDWGSTYPASFPNAGYSVLFNSGIPAPDPAAKAAVIGFLDVTAGPPTAYPISSTDDLLYSSHIMTPSDLDANGFQRTTMNVETLALTFNVRFSDDNVYSVDRDDVHPCWQSASQAVGKYTIGGQEVRFGDLVYNQTGSGYHGKTARDILAIANNYLSGKPGGPQMPSGSNAAVLLAVLQNINGNFLNCTCNEDFLRLPPNAIYSAIPGGCSAGPVTCN